MFKFNKSSSEDYDKTQVELDGSLGNSSMEKRKSDVEWHLQQVLIDILYNSGVSEATIRKQMERGLSLQSLNAFARNRNRISEADALLLTDLDQLLTSENFRVDILCLWNSLATKALDAVPPSDTE